MRRRKPQLTEMEITELLTIVELTKTSVLDTTDHEKLKAAIDTLIWTLSELEKKSTTLARLRKELSINTKKTEKASTVLKGTAGTEQPQGNSEETRGQKKKKKKKPKGHGRNGADAYWGAETIKIPHESLRVGLVCPLCERGKLGPYKPRRLVRLRGQAPIQAKIWEIEGLRCNLCGEVFRPEVPKAAGEERYDETSASMIGLLKYGTGLPFYRLAKLEGSVGIPLPVSTQWGIVKDAAQKIAPAYEELTRQGAQGDIVYNDDTAMKILDLLKENEQIQAAGSKERTGMFTTSIVSTSEGRRIALFFTGRQHAGENMDRLLEHRATGLDPPIQMCDGLSRNLPKDFETLLANCLTHGRRKFVDVVENFPQECRHVIEILAKVYKNDAITREREMSAQERLRYHQAHSAELMEGLEQWMTQQIADKKIEPNSSLGGAISYMLNRWDKLTLFLRQPGAPLDNNICERALKKTILHRKNALFYKTENGAEVGDIFMSLIYTAELSGVNPFDYLTALLKHPEELRRKPEEWMPWTYQVTVAAIAKASARS